MSTIEAPPIQLWAQCHSVGLYGYADSNGEFVPEPTIKAAAAVFNQPDQLQDISWVNFTVVVEGQDYKVGESIIATGQRSLNKVTFQPVSTVIERGKLTAHTARWVGYLASGRGYSGRGQHTPENEPDRFGDLLVLAYRSGALERDS